MPALLPSRWTPPVHPQELMVEGLQCPYWRHFMMVPLFFAKVLVRKGYSALQSDGETLVDMCSDPAYRQSILDALLKEVPPPHDASIKEDLAYILDTLLRHAMHGQQTSSYSNAQLHYQSHLASLFANSFDTEEILPLEVSRWRHWSPGKLLTLTPTTQRSVELYLRRRWLERTISHFVEFAAQILYMANVMDMPNPIQEYMDLFGDARFRTIRLHCLRLEGILKLKTFKIPWTEVHVRSLMNARKDEGDSANKIQALWDTLKFYSKKLGMLKLDQIDSLRAKKEAILFEMTKVIHKPVKRCKLPKETVIMACEEGSMRLLDGLVEMTPKASKLLITDAVILTVARFNLGSCARLSDIQHCAPSSYLATDNTREFHPWQSKAVSVHKVSKRPIPLIAPLHSFSGKPWWKALDKFLTMLKQVSNWAEQDFLLPAVNKERTGFYPRPCSYDRALRWLKEALYAMGVPEEDIDEVTWHSFRLFMAEVAFLAKVSQDRRQYLGNWAHAETPDVYTRDKRQVVCEIWQTALGYSAKAHGTSIPEDTSEFLDASYWWTPKPASKPSHETEKVVAEAAKKGAKAKSPAKRKVSDVPDLESQDPQKTPADLVAAPMGPLVPTIRLKAEKGKFRLHLFTQHLKCVGCGWQPGFAYSSKVTPLERDDFLAEVEKYQYCTPSFVHYSLPKSWTGTTGGETPRDMGSDSDAPASSSSECPSDDDTASEDDLVKPNMGSLGEKT